MPMTHHIRRSRSSDLAVKNKSELVDFSELDWDEFYHSPALSFSLSRCVCHSPSAYSGFTKLQEHNVTRTELSKKIKEIVLKTAQAPTLVEYTVQRPRLGFGEVIPCWKKPRYAKFLELRERGRLWTAPPAHA